MAERKVIIYDPTPGAGGAGRDEINRHLEKNKQYFENNNLSIPQIVSVHSEQSFSDSVYGDTSVALVIVTENKNSTPYRKTAQVERTMARAMEYLSNNLIPLITIGKNQKILTQAVIKALSAL